MKKKSHKTTVLPGLGWLFLSAAFLVSCQKTTEPLAANDASLLSKKNDQKQTEAKKTGHFDQVNLTANNTEYGAPNIDPSLVNAWGLAFSSGGTPWISSQGGHVSNVYNSEGVPRVPLNPVSIPSPGGATGGNPTGIVFNGNTSDFIIPSHGSAAFIFDGVDGVISAWNGSLGKQAQKITTGAGAYTGLAIAASGGHQFIYGANFATGHIDVWNSSWTQVSMPFADPYLPAGYMPFNIQAVGENLFVTYAKVDPNTHRSQAGDGLGVVDVFSSSGSFIKRFASNGPLNAPWGLAMVPRSFFKHEMDEDEDADHKGKDENYILVGNFGNGRINAYRTDGKFVGQLRGKKDPVAIEGLWAITLAPSTSTIDQNRLYFTAGPDEETHGLFGYLIAKDDD